MFSFRSPDIFTALTGGGPGRASYHAGIFLKDTIYKYVDFGKAAAIGVTLFFTVAIFAVPTLYFGVLKRRT